MWNSTFRFGAILSSSILALAASNSALAADVEDVAYRVHIGEQADDFLGWTVAGLGDTNGDGVNDYVVSALGIGPFFEGGGYVFSGATGDLLRTLIVGDGQIALGGWSLSSAGDINNDGRDDIIMGRPFSGVDVEGYALVFSGATGQIILTIQGIQESELTGYSVAGVGDVNADGFDDVIVGSPYYRAFTGYKAGRIVVHSGADGSHLLDWFSVGGAKFGYAVTGLGDVNGDGSPDVAVGAPGIGRVYVLDARNHHAIRTLTGSVSQQFGKNMANAGDVNGDGVNDLLVGSNLIAYLYDGASGQMLRLFASGLSTAMAGAGDVNNDGFDDVILGDSWGGVSGDGRVEIRSGIDGGLLRLYTGVIAQDTIGPSVATLGDINGDGHADLLIGASRAHGDYGAAYVLQGSGNSLTMVAGANYAVYTPNPVFTIAVDLDKRNNADLVSLNGSTNLVTVQLNRGDGTFNDATLIGTGPNPTSATPIDVDRDGDKDLVVACAGENRIRFFRNDNASFVLSGSLAVGNWPSSVTSGDFNRDGFQDLAVVNRDDDTVTVFLHARKTSGGFSTRFALGVNFLAGDGPSQIIDADFNNDGFADLAVADAQSHQIAILLNKQTGRFRKPRFTAMPDEPAGLFAKDLDGDHFMDLTCVGVTNDLVMFSKGLGVGYFAPVQIYVAGADPTSVGSFDMNHDDFPDLMVSNSGDNTVSVLINNQHGLFGQPTNTQTTVPPAWLTTADFDGDGDDDVATVGGSIGTSTILFNRWLE